MSASTGIRCDIFCRVVDNYGDIGVCWRLARQLVQEHHAEVRLVVDDLDRLSVIVPGVASDAKSQRVEDVEIVTWPHAAALQPADFVIEAFACELPETYVEVMARAGRAPVWVNLEYLSAEAWVDGHHGLPSPHPRLPLVKHFFFPGFTSRSGGLLRERDLLARRDRWDAERQGGARKVFLFGYANRAQAALLQALEHGLHAAEVTVMTPDRGTAAAPPRFVAQAAFDELLWRHDVLFVRGEDSFVRAQWAARPLVWHIYPQSDGAHWVKLDAFLDRYLAGLAPAAAESVRTLWRAWNAEDAGAIADAWSAYSVHLPELTDHARRWAESLSQMPDLATNLVTFYREKATI